jgi:hypothetical protein
VTALQKYERLEASGLWRGDPRDQRRDVVVSFGDATLVMSDPRSGRVLSHWSLPAVMRLNPGRMPALYSPDGDVGESLELTENVLIDALEEIRSALAAERGRSGRLRLGVAGLVLAGLILLGNFWLPGTLVSHAAAVLPMAKRASIGQEVVDGLVRAGAQVCAVPRGRAALDRLVERLLDVPQTQAVVMDFGPLVADGQIVPPIALPGRLLLLDRRMIEAHDTPDVAAGFLLAAALMSETADPLVPLLQSVGTGPTLRLLTVGTFTDTTLDDYGTSLIARPVALPPTDRLLTAFARALVPSRPFAYALDPTGERTLGLIEADPFRDQLPPVAVLADGDWINLQSICAP